MTAAPRGNAPTPERVRTVTAPSGRVVGLVIPAGQSVPDGAVRDYLTPPDWPLQMVLLDVSAGYRGQAHVHDPLPPATWPARHSIMLVQNGTATIRLYDADGRPAEDVTVGAGAAVVCLEGHQVTAPDAAARVLEIKQGPYRGEAADRRLIGPDATAEGAAP